MEGVTLWDPWRSGSPTQGLRGNDSPVLPRANISPGAHAPNPQQSRVFGKFVIGLYQTCNILFKYIRDCENLHCILKFFYAYAKS